jgi:hypothetical protein
MQLADLTDGDASTKRNSSSEDIGKEPLIERLLPGAETFSKSAGFGNFGEADR